MANQSNIVINDGQASPAAVTFTTAGVKFDAKSDKIIATYCDNSSGIAIGRRTLRANFVNFSKQHASNGVMEEVYDVEVPVLETLAGSTEAGYAAVPKVAYIVRAQLKFWLPTRATLQNRKDVLAFSKNYLAHSVVTAGIQDLDPVS
jgi:hypothetical protein